MKTGAQTEVRCTQSKAATDFCSRQKVGRQGRALLQSLWREPGPADTGIWDFWPPGLWDSKCLSFEAPGVWYVVRAALGNYYTWGPPPKSFPWTNFI